MIWRSWVQSPVEETFLFCSSPSILAGSYYDLARIIEKLEHLENSGWNFDDRSDLFQYQQTSSHFIDICTGVLTICNIQQKYLEHAT